MGEDPRAQDLRFLAAAIRLGSTALGRTHPNPAVGAILVRDGLVVGRGRTATGGRPHAERVALQMAGDKAKGATLYVSLEPCAHHGRTPPCTEAIIGAGVARVVAAIGDPDKRVSGAGFKALRDAGIEVTEPLLSKQAAASHIGHFHLMNLGRPYVALKLAVSRDDAVAREGEVQTPVSGAIAKTYVQALRSSFDAIMVGSGTVSADDPRLTVRLPGLEDRSPTRIVLDSHGSLSSDHQVFADGSAPTIRYVSASAYHAVEANLRKSADQLLLEVSAVGSCQKGLDLSDVFADLARRKLGRLLVEGGPELARSLLEADLVDQATIIRSPDTLGGRIVPALAGMPMSFIEKEGQFIKTFQRPLGSDDLSIYLRREPLSQKG